jgi:exopolysaccharide biosynthesis polyprenyl glycosylphosphotransferase
MQVEELMERGQDGLASALVDVSPDDFIGVERKPGADQSLRDDKAARMFELHASQNFKKVQAIQRMRLLLLLWVIRNKIERSLKRVFDFTVSLLALPFLAPIMLVTAILIKLDSPGPILFRQERVGKWSKPFTCYKFRSMHVDAEERKKALLSLNEADQIIFKMKKDPRVTRVGRVIRKLSIDELPQIFNVIKGDMSLVGPRPPVPYEVDQYQYDVRRRLEVVPGITGLQQVSGRSDIEFNRWVELDLQYIQDQSLLKDIQILLKTIPTVLSGKGAY